jgi:hypothetical protein
MRERQCPFASCLQPYTKKRNHVKQYHKNDAYDFFIGRYIDSKSGLCHICKIAFSGKARDHVSTRHREKAFTELAKEKFEWRNEKVGNAKVLFYASAKLASPVNARFPISDTESFVRLCFGVQRLWMFWILILVLLGRASPKNDLFICTVEYFYGAATWRDQLSNPNYSLNKLLLYVWWE